MMAIAAAILLSGAMLGCHTTKVTMATAVADSIANVQKTNEDQFLYLC